MHIAEVDARRREGLTSWEAYGNEAATAEGRRRLGRVRRDAKGRLKALAGVRVGDLRALMTPSALGQVELTLMLWRTGKLSADQAREDLLKLFRERPERGETMLTAFRGSLQGQIGIGEHGYPFTAAFLDRLRRQGHASRLSGRERPLIEAIGEETLVAFFSHT